ncbi:hypothetical protein [Streptomyces sp. NPDC020489]|uniref:hypothetical protein n=1 Tax=Streptomyces sp. NPDC020489 TaxID=3365077 RepID=UPI0037A91716
MSESVECPMCHQPTRSAAARSRGGIGGRCWRKLRPDQRASLRRSPGQVRRILAQPPPATDSQLPIDQDQERTT